MQKTFHCTHQQATCNRCLIHNINKLIMFRDAALTLLHSWTFHVAQGRR